MTTKKLMLGVGIPVLLFAVLAGIYVSYLLIPVPGGLGSWGDYRDGNSLITASERVVLATYLDEETHETPTVTDDDGNVVSSVTHIFRRFSVLESLKGDAQEGDTLYVTTTVGVKTALYAGKTENLSYDAVQLDADERYVLFLQSRPVRAGTPSQYGDTVWTRPGEPGVAQLDSDGRLTFLATDRYKDTIEAEGLERATDSDAPFEMTKGDITGSDPAK